MSAYEKVRTGKLVLKGEKSRYNIRFIAAFVKFNMIFIYLFCVRSKKRKSKKQEKEQDVTVEDKDTVTHGIF